MTDYKEEQANELEALESIYPDELILVSRHPYPTFTVSLAGEYVGFAHEEEEAEQCSCVLEFTYTEKYPDEAPVMEIQVESIENMDDQQVDKINDIMTDQVEENMGMAMVFSIVAAVQEEMHSLMENLYTEKKDAKEKAKEEEEAAERKRFEGTCVSIETFLVWKAKFDAEIEERKRQQGKLEKGTTKLTGLQLFKENAAMDDSDVAFLEEEGDSVAVDESLFDDIDDLQLDEEDDLDES